MRKLSILIYILVLLSVVSLGQTTVTTATVRYPDGQPFINGTVQAVFTPPTGIGNQNQYLLNGAAFPYFVNGAMDGTGTFTLVLTNDHKVRPQGGRWSFSVCSQATVPCNTSLQDVFGVSIDLSTLISNDVLSIHASASNLPRYYSDSEVDANSFGGQTYFNLISGTVRCWDGLSWSDCGSGGGGGGGGGGTSSLSVSPTNMHFGTQTNNVPSQPQEVTLINTGTSPISVFGFTQTGNAGQTNFKSSDPTHCNIIIQGNNKCTLLFFYQPTGATNDSTTLTFTSSVPPNIANPTVIFMDGSGTPLATFNLTVDGDAGSGTGLLKSEENPPLINAVINPDQQCLDDCGNSYTTGTSVTVDASAQNGTFDHFTGTGSAAACSTNPSCTFVMTADSNLSVTFAAPVITFTLNIVAGPGQGQGTITSDDGQINCTINAGVLSGVSCHGTYNQGATPILTETPFAGCPGGACTFNSWNGAPPPITGCTNSSTCQPTLNDDTNISGSFSLANAGAPLQLIQKLPGGVSGSSNITGTWPSAQQVGDTNILGIQINDATTTITGVTDNAGNTYTQLGGGCSPKAGNGNTTAVYIANNIVASSANTNLVTVTLSANTSTYRGILGLEYSGLQNPPLDVCNGATGASSTVNAGNLVTTNASDLLFSNSIVLGAINSPSAGWAQEIVFHGNDVEDRTVTATGTYNNSTIQTGTTFSSIDAAFKTQGVLPVQFSINITGASGSNGSGIVTAPGLNCSITNGVASITGCSVIVAAGSTLALNAAALAGSGFLTYGGSGCTNNPQCTTQAITTNSVIAVNFTLAGSTNYWVSTTGNDANNGLSLGTAWRHISKAINSFVLGANGTTINVHAGTYSDENFVNCNGYNAAICLTRGGSSPTIRLRIVCDTQWSVPSSTGCLIRDPAGETIVSLAANNVDIGGLNSFGFDMSNPNLAYAIAGNCSIPNHGIGNCSKQNSIHVYGNYIHDFSTSVNPCEVNPNGHPAIIPQNHHGPYITDFQVIGNRITDIGNQTLSKLNGGPGCFNYYGMYIDTSEAIIQNNIISNTAGYALQYYSAPCKGNISNNVFVRNEFPNVVIGGGDCSNGIPQGNITFSNNYLGQTASSAHVNLGVPGGSGVGSSGHGILATNNIFSDNSVTQFNIIAPNNVTQANTRTEAPTTTFVGYTGGFNDNFHLKAGSVAIGGGTTNCVIGGITPCVPSTTFSGTTPPNPRNVGAY